MTNYIGLQQLINHLEYGTKLHISVVFQGNYGNEKTLLSHESSIHSKPVCDEAKSMPNGFKRCFTCRNTALKKALDTKLPFGGLCINGVYEYCRPVVENNDVICIIFIGNILSDDEALKEKIRRRLPEKESLTDTLEKSFSQNSCEELSLIIEAYIKMLLITSEKNTDKEFNPLIENIKSYIDANMSYDISLFQTAKFFHYNEKYLGRLFKKETGQSFKQYLNMIRAEHAKKLLTDTNDTVINISLKAGFNNVTYFNRVFKSQFHMCPVEYRRKYS